MATRRGNTETGTPSSESEKKDSFAERSVRALPLCVRSVSDRIKKSPADGDAPYGAGDPYIDRIKKSLAKGAVCALPLCVRPVFDRIHHVSPTTTNCALDRCTRQLRVLLLLIAHWTAVQEKGCHRTSRTRLTVVRAIRV